MKISTKDEYLQWLASRGPSGSWDHEACRTADQLIKDETLKTFANKIEGLNPELEQWIISLANHHFGSVETDNMLTSLDCYPSWINV
jgi:hypothetical protein